MSAAPTAKTPPEVPVLPQRDARPHVGRLVEALAPHYRCDGAAARRPEPLEELVLALLSEGVPRKQAARAGRDLARAFVDWNEVRISRPGEVRAVLEPMDDAAGRAERIVRALNSIFAARGELSLAFLHDLSPKEAEDFLGRIEGLNRQARARILLFALGQPALPVTPQILRVAARLGLVPNGEAPEAAGERLEKIVPRAQMALFYSLFNEHGRKTCLAAAPHCRRCPVRSLCPTGRAFRQAAPCQEPASVAPEGKTP